MVSDYSDQKILDVVNKLLLKQTFSTSEDSSVFLIVPTSDEYDSESSIDGADSTICIQLSETFSKWDRNDERTRSRLNSKFLSVE